jgi:hypothetical protein
MQLTPLSILFGRYPAVFPQLLHLASKAVEVREDYRLGDPAVSEVLGEVARDSEIYTVIRTCGRRGSKMFV